MVNLISEKILQLVEASAGEIMKKWIEGLYTDPMTASFLDENTGFVENKARVMLKNMIYWISNDISKEELGIICFNEGREMFGRGIPLCEVTRAMNAGRRTLLQYTENGIIIESALQIHQMREFDKRVTLFFDRAQYYMIRGYIEEMRSRASSLNVLMRDNSDEVFFDDSFYN